jgi:signal transduction histidine kinase
MLELERMRIASDMHDDIGADLTQISMWTNILKTSEKNNPEVISKIVYSTNDVLQKMDQIIWALDSVHDKASDFVSYLKECIIRSLDSTGIKFTLQTNESIPDVKLSSIQRRNIFLVMKELLHNTIKHSRATEIKIKIIFDPSNINIAYSDNGRGFDSASGDGLGFTTMKKKVSLLIYLSIWINFLHHDSNCNS